MADAALTGLGCGAQEVEKIASEQRDATLRGGEVLSGDVQENGAARPVTHRPVVVAQHDDAVVDFRVAPQALMTRPVGQPDQRVVLRISGRVAPAVVGLQGIAGEDRRGRL